MVVTRSACKKEVFMSLVLIGRVSSTRNLVNLLDRRRDSAYRSLMYEKRKEAEVLRHEDGGTRE